MVYLMIQIFQIAITVVNQFMGIKELELYAPCQYNQLF